MKKAKIKIKIPKSIKLYLIKQLNKLSDLNFTGVIHRRLLAAAPCSFPRTQSMDGRRREKKIPDLDLVQYVADHESDLGDVNRYEWMYFPSSIDPEISPSSSPSSSNGVKGKEAAGAAGAAAAVVTFSTDPYGEFRRSMVAMLEACRTGDEQPLDPDLLTELVFCYFAENEKRMHKNILRAYTDIMMEIIRRDSSSGCEEEQEAAAAVVQLEEGR